MEKFMFFDFGKEKNNTKAEWQLLEVIRLMIIAIVVVLCISSTSFAQVKADSSIVSKGHDGFGTSSGWQNHRRFHSNTTPPKGTWKLGYKHWFQAAAEPAWAIHASPAKPAKADWNTAATIRDDKTTAIMGDDLQAYSEWYINPEKPWDFFGGGYYANYSTYSWADSDLTGGKASSKSRIRDPWEFDSPNIDPEFPEPLDPSGKWELGGGISLAGDIDLLDVSSGDGSIGLSYAVSVNSSAEEDAQEFLNILITPEGSEVNMTLPLGADSVELFLGNYTSATSITEAGLEAYLDSYLTPTGWSLNPELDMDTFQPDQDAYLDQVCSMFMFIHFEQDVELATVFTERSTYAVTVPEPATICLLGFGALGLLRKNRA